MTFTATVAALAPATGKPTGTVQALARRHAARRGRPDAVGHGRHQHGLLRCLHARPRPARDPCGVRRRASTSTVRSARPPRPSERCRP
ncbi:hypothetical protein G5V59_09930 [Nocardioides sp. W3-2-3]|nr:hypothetical protein [Nocardioides convexus]